MHRSLYNKHFHSLLRPLAKAALCSTLFSLLLRRLKIRSVECCLTFCVIRVVSRKPILCLQIEGFSYFCLQQFEGIQSYLELLDPFEAKFVLVRDKVLISFFCMYPVLPTLIIEGAILFPMYIFAPLSSSS